MAASNPANPKNEFDFVGEIHNQIVSEFITETEGQKLTNKEVLEKVESITLSNTDYSKHFGTEYYGLTEEQVDEGINDFSNEFENIISDLPISEESKAIFNELIGKTFEIENSQLSYEEYKDYVLQLEEKTFDNNALPEKEKDSILYTTSVARYSSYLWVGSKDDSTSKKHFGWVIAGDVAGGIIGGIFGGVGGAISGASGGSSLVHTINESK